MVELQALLVRMLGFVRFLAKFSFMADSVLSQCGLRIHHAQQHTHQHTHDPRYVHGYLHCPHRGSVIYELLAPYSV